MKDFLWTIRVQKREIPLLPHTNYINALLIALTWIHQYLRTDLHIWLWMFLITDSLVHHVLFMSVDSSNVANSFTSFDNKGIDAININNILNHKDVLSFIPPHFKMKSTHCISYRYTSTITSQLFNYKQTLQCLSIEQLRQNPKKCSCSSYHINYIITTDVNTIQNEDLRSLILKGFKFLEPRLFNWQQMFMSIMDYVE
jgi:hypothetical protein